jgi:hypothetical protein
MMHGLTNVNYSTNCASGKASNNSEWCILVFYMLACIHLYSSTVR